MIIQHQQVFNNVKIPYMEIFKNSEQLTNSVPIQRLNLRRMKFVCTYGIKKNHAYVKL